MQRPTSHTAFPRRNATVQCEESSFWSNRTGWTTTTEETGGWGGIQAGTRRSEHGARSTGSGIKSHVKTRRSRESKARPVNLAKPVRQSSNSGWPVEPLSAPLLSALCSTTLLSALLFCPLLYYSALYSLLYSSYCSLLYSATAAPPTPPTPPTPCPTWPALVSALAERRVEWAL